MRFEPINLQMKSLVERYLNSWRLSGSEYTFTNLLIWGTNGRIKVAEYESALYIKLRYGNDEPFMLAPLTLDVSRDYGNVVRLSDEYMYDSGYSPTYRAISGPLVKKFAACCPDHTLTEDRDNFDYVYLSKDLILLSGKKFHSKRNNINRFKSEYSFEYVRIIPDMLNDCLEVYSDWLHEKDKLLPGMLGELDAIKAAITNMDVLGVKGGGIRIDGKLRAFSLGQLINEDMAVIHIEKANESFEGIYSVINQQFAEHEWSGVKYINREEDMGIEGLRKAKLSYRPVELIQKYVAKPALTLSGRP